MNKDYGDAIRSIEKGQTDPLYFLRGEDRFLQTFFVKKIEKGMFGDGTANISTLNPDEISSKEIIERLNRTDLFASKTIFVLRQPQLIRGAYRDGLMAYCKHPPLTNSLIILHNEWQARTKYFKDMEKMSSSISVSTPLEPGMKKWTGYFFKERSLQVSGDVIQTIVDMAGDSLDHLQNEIEKISISLDNNEIVTSEKVRQFSGWQREHQRWEFFIALGEKKFPKTISLGKTLVTQNETLISLIYGLTSYYIEMWYLKKSIGTSQSYPGYTGLPPSVMKRLPQFAKSVTTKEVELALYLLSEMDIRVKSKTVDDETELLKFLLKIQSAHG
ncbi:MAG: DNA polymerase III subunit delta [Candidatus Marinimicrobia bacterium]|nr:DNA polymerase III subunit delta [Candidatus Neomarinimicrobiota bacterium]